jgi:hypothetical protein
MIRINFEFSKTAGMDRYQLADFREQVEKIISLEAPKAGLIWTIVNNAAYLTVTCFEDDEKAIKDTIYLFYRVKPIK